ncbi:unnamed protein product [Schistocephalus solidus]|uniref:Proton-coupled folate transporter n=1 Tax=Schistocephalus solidus TaxID=70667 RepID=A0A183SYQ0_SCHSO|nr:unnamed protein product [Schistocephalus solidus]
MRRLQSRLPSLIIFSFALYKTTETLLQTSVRLQVYHLVCKWLTNNSIRDSLCSPMKNLQDWTNISDTPTAVLALTELDNRIQRTSVPYIVTYRVLLNLPAMVTCLVLGTLSDTHGRKTTFLAPIVGGALACCLFGVSLVPELLPVPDGISCLLIGALVYGLSGKSNSFGMGANSYITDCSSDEKRTVYISHLMGANFIGLCIGSALLSFFLFFTDFGWILLFVCLTNLVIFTLILVFVQESVVVQSDVGDYGATVYTGTNWETVTEAENYKSPRFFQMIYFAFITSYKFLVTKRPNHAHVYLRCLFGAVLFNQITKAGEQDAIMLYVTRNQVGWSDMLYGAYIATYYAAMAFHLMVILPLASSCFHPSDTSIILYGLFMKIGRLIATAVSPNTYVLFVSAVLGSSAGYITTGIRSLISKLVNEDEVGTGFAFMSVLETFSNLFGSLLFTSVYAGTLTVYPGLVFLMDALLHGCLFFVMIWLSVRLRAHFAVTNNAP